MKNMAATKYLFTACLLVGLFALTSVAQTRPNFTGDWKLNLQKSNSSDGVRMELNHKDNNLIEAFTDFQGGGDGVTVEGEYVNGGNASEVRVGCRWINSTTRGE